MLELIKFQKNSRDNTLGCSNNGFKKVINYLRESWDTPNFGNIGVFLNLKCSAIIRD